MILLSVLRACTKPMCVIKPGGTHILYVHNSLILQNKQDTQLTFKSLIVYLRDHAHQMEHSN